MNFYDELLSDKKEEKTYPEITAPGLLNAIVKDIWDKDHMGMIKVEYLMGEKDKKTSDWVRVMTGYGGNGFGNYWLPDEYAGSAGMSVERNGQAAGRGGQ